jgi:hypothetical protein
MSQRTGEVRHNDERSHWVIKQLEIALLQAQPKV